MIARRGFLAGILAAGVAPAAVGSQILMPVRKLIVPRNPILWYDELKGDLIVKPQGITLIQGYVGQIDSRIVFK